MIYFSISFIFTLQILLDLVLHLLFFFSYLCYCIYYQFISLCILRNPLTQKWGKRPTVSFFFFSRHIWKQVLLFFFFEGTCFKFYWKVFWFKLLSVFYNILQGTKYLWNTVAVSFLPKFIAGCFELGKKMRPDVFQRHYTLCDGALVCILFSKSLALLIFNSFSRLLF